MKVTYNWLKDFVAIKIAPPALAEKLTMAGLEVVSLQQAGEDAVFEIEITSNRPDWLSVLGIAREVAAITNTKLKVGAKKSSARVKKDSSFKIAIENKKDCPLYTVRVMRNIKVGPSVDWIKNRLELIGVRSVNNVVDITNYVLFELGQPLHAFDLDKLGSGYICVRRGKAKEEIATIDGSTKSLNENILVIADSHSPLAVAGVMGGRDSEVNFGTKNILLESALFDPVVVRRSRQCLGIQSESSYRFERGVDLEMVEKASLRAAQLLEEYCKAETVSFNVSGPSKKKEKKVALDLKNTARVLGLRLPDKKIKQILTSLGFKIKNKSNQLLGVTVPAFRPDVNTDVDLIEEASRIFGFQNIPATLPAIKPYLTTRERRSLVSGIKNTLIGLGLTEAVTYSLTDKPTLNVFSDIADMRPVEIMNPLSQEQEVLRSTLIPGLVKSVSFNLNQKQNYIALFEIANIYLGNDKPLEELVLGIALSGAKSLLLEQGAIKEEVNLLSLKGIVGTLFLKLGIDNYDFNQTGGNVDINIGNIKVGRMHKLDGRQLDAAGIKNKDVFVTEISLDKTLSFSKAKSSINPIPKYPGINRDISFAIKEETMLKMVLAALKEKGQPLLREIRVTDCYKGKQISSGYRGLTLSCTYVSNERTLTEEEVQPVHKELCQLLTQQFGAQMR